MATVKTIQIDALKLDKRNANQGTEEGKALLKKSLKNYGAGRSVLTDKDLNLIAGNHTVQEAKAQGFKEVVVVETTGDQLVVVQRTDLEAGSRAAIELGLADNRVGQANLNFDVDVIQGLQADFGVDLVNLGIDLGDANPGAGAIFRNDYDGEPDAAEQMEHPDRMPDNSVGGGGEEIDERAGQNFFPLSIALTKAQRLDFDAWKKRNGHRTDTEGFLAMFHDAKEYEDAGEE